jgi:hypothetical protein
MRSDWWTIALGLVALSVGVAGFSEGSRYPSRHGPGGRLYAAPTRLRIALAVLGCAYIVRGASQLLQRPVPAEEAFLERFLELGPTQGAPLPERVLRERQQIAEGLGLPVERLRPDQTIDELCPAAASRRHSARSGDPAWDDLVDEAEDARRQAGLAIHDVVDTPRTVAELIAYRLLLDAKPPGNPA